MSKLIKKNQNTLIVTDIQVDFCPGGRLAVEEGDRVIPVINRMAPRFDNVVATQDWHPPGHRSFASNHPGRKIYDTIDLEGISQVLWPEHCVQGSEGAAFHPHLDLNPVNIVIRKGTNPDIDSYSTFLENDKKTRTGLEGYLKGLGIRQVFLSGLATDYCVLYSAVDAVHMGFETFVVLDACRGVDVPEHNVEKSLEIMRQKGICIIRSEDL